MIGFWLLAALITAITASALVWPLVSRDGAAKAGQADKASKALAIYRDQLAEIDRDLARGVIPESEAAQHRAEVERRMLAAARQRQRHAAPRLGPAPRGTAVALCLLLPVSALGLYLSLGRPDLPASPLAARDDSAREGLEQATERLPALRARVAADPDDLEAWLALADAQRLLGRFQAAEAALRQAMRAGNNAPVLQLAHAEMLVVAEEGVVVPEALAVFRRFPAAPTAAYHLALHAYQEGRLADALARWQAMLAASPAESPWRETVSARIRETARALGTDPDAALETAQAAPPQRGPSQAQLDAAAGMSPADQYAMASSMVASLAARLDQEPEDLEGWMRLGRTASVLAGMAPDENTAQRWRAQAMTAYGHAVDLAPENLEVLFLAGQAALEAGARDKALAWLETVLNRLPADAPGRAGLAAEVEALRAGPPASPGDDQERRSQ